MSTRLDSLVIDTPDPQGLAAWWSAALTWPMEPDRSIPEPSDVVVRPPDGEPGLELVFGACDDPKQGKNRIHLDLASASLQDQQELTDRLVRLGARPVDIGQSNVPWVVLADPEGNELCALDPRDRYQASGAVAAVVVDALDPASLARFWAAATGWTLTDSGPNGAALHPTTRRGRPGPAGPGRPVGPGKPVGPVGPVKPVGPVGPVGPVKPVGPVGPVGPVKPVGPGRPVGRVGPVGPVRPAVGPFLEFVPTELAPRVKNRLHLDIRPEPGGDQDAEVERLIRLGAHPVEIGQSAAPPGQVHWVVLADPEGNEFCVLRTPG